MKMNEVPETDTADGNDVMTAEPVEQAPSSTPAPAGEPKTKQDSITVGTAVSTLVSTSQSQPPSGVDNSRKYLIWGLLGLIIVIVVIVLAVVLTGKDETTDEYTPDAMDFSTGVSLITSYAVETRVRSRLAQTKITIEVANALDCSSIHAISLQLPHDTRITSVKTVTDDDCTAEGEVQELEDARETFVETASKGIPGAYVEARDSSTHSIQVAIPPLGTSYVELVLEQLLKQRLDEVKFEFPLAPNEEVDGIVFDLFVEDTDGQPVDFDIDLNVPGIYEPGSIEGDEEDSNSAPATEGNAEESISATASEVGAEDSSTTVEENESNATNAEDNAAEDSSNSTRRMSTNTKPIHLEIPDARQHNLPKIIRGTYSPGELPDNGLLYTDGRCFEHFFHPSSLDPMPRNFVFLIDTSDSMDHNSKLVNAKEALNLFIDSLKPEDNFRIQSFGGKGTEKLWGSGPGTAEEKEDAKQFVNDLYPSSWSTNLHEAYLEGLLRAKHDAEVSDDNVATILVMLADGWASRGETNRTKIAEHVFSLNEEGTVKIFNLGFEGYADMELLDAIALMNGGVSAPIREGHDGFARQITNFLESEIGSVLMSDVSVEYFVGLNKEAAYGETQTRFPVLADGYEVVVRGLIEEIDDDSTLDATTSAYTMDGIKDWKLTSLISKDDAARSSLCFQSYAHDRITQLMRLYDVSGFLGNELIKKLITLKKACEEEDFSKCIKAEALDLALEASIVTKGLTAMVTVDSEKCMKHDDDAEVCLDGSPDGTPDRDYYYDDYGDAEDEAADYNWETGAAEPASVSPESGYYGEDGPYRWDTASAAPRCKLAISFLVLLCAWFFVAVFKV